MPLVWGNTGSNSTTFALAREGERWLAEQGGAGGCKEDTRKKKEVMEAGFILSENTQTEERARSKFKTLVESLSNPHPAGPDGKSQMDDD